MDISFVIPCYCSEKNLEGVIEEIRLAMKQKPNFQYEIILVNDNSKDGTASLIQHLAEKDSRITGIDFAKNFGQPSALMAGFRAAQGDIIMTSDDDGQSPVEKVWEFYEKIQEGYDIVCAKYTERHQKSGFRRLGTRVNEFMLQYMLNKPKDTYLASFFMAKRFVIEEMTRYTNPYPYIAGLLLRSTSKIGYLEMEQRERKTGSSGYTFKKLINLWMNGFTAFSIKPLRIATGLGFISAGIGLIVMICVLLQKIFMASFSVGHSLFIGILLFVSGIIMCLLGIIGEYVGRIYMCINNNPQYVIRNIIKTPKEGESIHHEAEN